MPWVVGIDEAGYGPNLGPLVQAAVALYLPDDDPAGWTTLKGVVRRCGERKKKGDERLLIDDSKKVYARGGFEALERGVLRLTPISVDVAEFVRKVGLKSSADDLGGETWYQPTEELPLTPGLGRWWEATRPGLPWPEGVKVGGEEVSIVAAPRFNRICDESGSKGTVLARGLVELLSQYPANLSRGDEPIHFLCDKQGGRNFYAALIQQAFPTGWVVIEKESAEESRYRVEQLGRPVTVTFRPRADGDSVSVALASMLCKYLREVCMRQFNRFWATHVPGIAPTAGYPVDAKRFFAEINPAMAKLGLTDDQVWRKK